LTVLAAMKRRAGSAPPPTAATPAKQRKAAPQIAPKPLTRKQAELRKQAEAAATVAKRKAAEVQEETRKQAEPKAVAAKKKAKEEVVSKAAEATAVAKKRADMAAAKKKANEEMVRKAAEATAMAKKKADMAAAKIKAPGAVKAAHQQAEAAEAIALKMAEEREVVRQAVETAAAAHSLAEKESWSAQRVAEEADLTAKKLAEEAVAAQKVAELAAAAASDARSKAEKAGDTAQRQAAEAVEAMRRVEEQAARAAAQKAAEEDAVRCRAEEELRTVDELKALCKSLDLTATEDRTGIMEVLEGYFDQEEEAACRSVEVFSSPERRAQNEEAVEVAAEKQAAEEKAVRRRAEEEAAKDAARKRAAEEEEGEEATWGVAEEAAAVERRAKQSAEEQWRRATINSPQPAEQPRMDAELPPAETPVVRIAKAVSSSSSAARREQVDADAPADSPWTFPAPKAVGHSFADTAAARHQELGRRLVAKREALDKKLAEVQEAEVARSSAAARINAAEEAAKPDAKRKEEAFTAAKQNAETCSSESLGVKAARASFMELQEAPLEPAALRQKRVNDLKPRLKFFCVEQDAIDCLESVLAKKRRLKSDSKVLSSIDEALAVRDRATAFMLGQCKAEVARCAEAVGAVAAATQLRTEELSGFDEVLKARETERKSCEEQVSAALCELSEHEGRMTREGFMRFSLSGEQCAICCNDISAGAAVLLGCNHGWYCPECMKRFVEARLDAGAAGDVPCPDCGLSISENDLITLLPRKTIFRLHARSSEQKDIASGARACPTPNCPWRLSLNADGSGERQTCPLCDVESCLLCGTAPYHEGRTCEEHRKSLCNKDEQSFFKWMEATGSKQCPTCNMAMTKENLEKQSQQRSECHKMLCRNCGTRFCFKCLAVLTETYTCGCSIDRHGFIDPHTGKIIKHLRRGKKRAG